MFSSCLYSHVAEILWVLERFLLCPKATLRATKTFPLIASQQALRGCILLCSWLSPVCVRARSFYGRCWGFPLSPRGFCGRQPGEMCTGLNYSLHSRWLHHTTGLSRSSHRALVKEANPTLTHLVRSTVKSIHRKYQAWLLPGSTGCHRLVPGKAVTLLFCPWNDYQDSPPSYFCTLLALESCMVFGGSAWWDSVRLGAFQEVWKESGLASVVGGGADSEIHSSVTLELTRAPVKIIGICEWIVQFSYQKVNYS